MHHIPHRIPKPKLATSGILGRTTPALYRTPDVTPSKMAPRLLPPLDPPKLSDTEWSQNFQHFVCFYEAYRVNARITFSEYLPQVGLEYSTCEEERFREYVCELGRKTGVLWVESEFENIANVYYKKLSSERGFDGEDKASIDKLFKAVATCFVDSPDCPWGKGDSEAKKWRATAMIREISESKIVDRKSKGVVVREWKRIWERDDGCIGAA